MQTSKVKVLEMLNDGLFEELKAILKDEIYADSLRLIPNGKKRYAAMKRYLKNISASREILTKPCEIEFDGSRYNSFCSGYSLALTKESCGELTMCDEPDRYPDVTRFPSFDNGSVKVDLERVLATAKSEGYRYKKSTIHDNKYLMHFGDAYFRIGLIDVTYGIIADGHEVETYHGGGERRPITFTTDIGIAVVMPLYTTDLEGCIVIEAN